MSTLHKSVAKTDCDPLDERHGPRLARPTRPYQGYESGTDERTERSGPGPSSVKPPANSTLWRAH